MDQVVLVAPDVENVVVIQSGLLDVLGAGSTCKVKNFLFGDQKGILSVETGEVDMLECVIGFVYFLKNLPSDLVFDTLGCSLEFLVENCRV